MDSILCNLTLVDINLLYRHIFGNYSNKTPFHKFVRITFIIYRSQLYILNNYILIFLYKICKKYGIFDIVINLRRNKILLSIVNYHI